MTTAAEQQFFDVMKTTTKAATETRRCAICKDKLTYIRGTFYCDTIGCPEYAEPKTLNDLRMPATYKTQKVKR